MANEMGGEGVKSIATASKEAKKGTYVLDDRTRAAMGELERQQDRKNTGIMLAGGAVFAAGAATWWARR